MRPITKNQMANFWLSEFVVDGHCGLCGNTGRISTTGRAITPAGFHCGANFACICPNGRAIRRQIVAYSKKCKEADLKGTVAI
jgi:hypothetical protein